MPDRDIAKTSENLEEFEDFQTDRSAKGYDLRAVLKTSRKCNLFVLPLEDRRLRAKPNKASRLIVQCSISWRDNCHSVSDAYS
jgi:hypothetical protein